VKCVVEKIKGKMESGLKRFKVGNKTFGNVAIKRYLLNLLPPLLLVIFMPFFSVILTQFFFGL